MYELSPFKSFRRTMLFLIVAFTCRSICFCLSWIYLFISIGDTVWFILSFCGKNLKAVDAWEERWLKNALRIGVVVIGSKEVVVRRKLLVFREMRFNCCSCSKVRPFCEDSGSRSLNFKFYIKPEPARLTSNLYEKLFSILGVNYINLIVEAFFLYLSPADFYISLSICPSMPPSALLDPSLRLKNDWLFTFSITYIT